MARHHHVMQGHLKLFLPENSKDGKLHVHSKTDGYLGRKAIRDIAYQEDANAEWAERRMSEIEGAAAKILRDIAAGTEPNHPQSAQRLLLYMALASSRHPSFFQEWRTRLVRSFSRNPRFLTDWRKILCDDVLFTGLFEAILPDIMGPLPALHWVTIRLDENEEEKFAISDRPVDIGYSGQYGVVNPRSLAIMPVSKDVLLVGGKDAEAIDELDLAPSVVNAVLLSRCREFIYSTNELDWDKLKRAADNVARSQADRKRIWVPPRHG